MRMQPNGQLSRESYFLQHTMCVGEQRCHRQHLGELIIPEGFITELAGVWQTSASFLLAASGHAEVTAAIGHL